MNGSTHNYSLSSSRSLALSLLFFALESFVSVWIKQFDGGAFLFGMRTHWTSSKNWSVMIISAYYYDPARSFTQHETLICTSEGIDALAKWHFECFQLEVNKVLHVMNSSASNDLSQFSWCFFYFFFYSFQFAFAPSLCLFQRFPKWLFKWREKKRRASHWHALWMTHR